MLRKHAEDPAEIARGLDDTERMCLARLVGILGIHSDTETRKGLSVLEGMREQGLAEPHREESSQISWTRGSEAKTTTFDRWRPTPLGHAVQDVLDQEVA